MVVAQSEETIFSLLKCLETSRQQVECQTSLRTLSRVGVMAFFVEDTQLELRLVKTYNRF